jgi:hypothetical protein
MCLRAVLDAGPVAGLVQKMVLPRLEKVRAHA